MTGNDSYTVSLLHMNGDNNGTSFPDVAAGGTHVWTPSGGVVTKTAIKKFGSASGYFPGSAGSYLYTPDSPDWYFGANNFTIDLWLYWHTGNISNSFPLFEQYAAYSDYNHLVWINNLNVYWECKVSGSFVISAQWVNCILTVDTWYHIALVRNGNNFRFFMNGVSKGTQTDTDPVPDNTANLNIGRSQYPATLLSAYVDEYRVSKGIARWWDNFTPPTEEYNGVSIAPSAYIL